jgi:threonine dehydratase
VLVRELVRSGRVARLSILAPDKPGVLVRIADCFLQHRVNIIEVHHQRIFTTLPAKDTLIEVECEARDAAAIDRVIEALGTADFRVERSTLD